MEARLTGTASKGERLAGLNRVEAAAELFMPVSKRLVSITRANSPWAHCHRRTPLTSAEILHQHLRLNSEATCTHRVVESEMRERGRRDQRGAEKSERSEHVSGFCSRTVGRD